MKRSSVINTEGLFHKMNTVYFSLVLYKLKKVKESDTVLHLYSDHTISLNVQKILLLLRVTVNFPLTQTLDV